MYYLKAMIAGTEKMLHSIRQENNNAVSREAGYLTVELCVNSVYTQCKFLKVSKNIKKKSDIFKT